MTVELSQHAIERFRERVRPGLDVDAAMDELARIVLVADLYDDAPPWLAARQRREAALYLVAGDVVLPLEQRESHSEIYCAVTCLARGGLSPEARARRRARRRRQARGRRWALAG